MEDATEVELPEGEDYDTVAGLVVRQLGKIPEPGDRVEVAVPDRSDPHEPRERLVTLTVERMDGLRIDRLDLRVVTPDTGAGADADAGTVAGVAGHER